MVYWAMVIEDNVALRLVLAEMLKEVGFEVLQAGNGNEALHYLEGVMPDLITLDIHIPGPSGVNLLQHIRKCKGGDRATIVVLTGDLPDDHAPEVALADLFLEKPVGMGALVELAERLTQSTDVTRPSGLEIRDEIQRLRPNSLNN